MTNHRFAEFVTSGAFHITLTRAQISSLMIVAGGSDCFSAGSLLRKGLVESFPRPDIGADHLEYRATPAGMLVAALLSEAGLANRRLSLAEELTRTQAELTAVRRQLAQTRLAARAAHARIEKTERERADIAWLLERATHDGDTGVRLKPQFVRTTRPRDLDELLSIKDPLPDTSNAGLAQIIESDA